MSERRVQRRSVNTDSDIYRFDEIDSLLSTSKLKIHQQNDSICQFLIDHCNNNTKNDDPRYKYLAKYYGKINKMLQNDEFLVNDDNILCVRSTVPYQNDRLYIPVNLVKIALQYIHKSTHFSHPGITQCKQIVEEKFYWYQWQKDTENYVKECPECQKAKGHKFHKRGLLSPVIAQQHNAILHVDFLGPFHGALSVMILVDNYTGYTMLVPTFGQTANDVIQAIWNVWRPIHGLPRQCLSDRGSGFISELNQRFYSTFGIQGLFTSGYHAQTNAKAERKVQETKKAIRMVNTTLNGELTEKSNKINAVNVIKLILPSIQFSLNQKPSTFAGISPNMLRFGENLNDAIDTTAALTNIKKYAKMKKFKEAKHTLKMLHDSIGVVRKHFDDHRWFYIANEIKKYNKNRKPDNFKANDLVMYYVGERNYPMKKIRSRFTGPFRIIKRINHNTVTIHNDSTNETMSCHTQKLKKYHENNFTDENLFMRQLYQHQKLLNEYNRKKRQQQHR